MTEKYLVTGGVGFIGSNICRRLVAEGCYVRVIDMLTGRKAIWRIFGIKSNLFSGYGDAQVACALWRYRRGSASGGSTLGFAA